MANGGESLFSDRYMKTTVIYGVDQMSASIFNGMQIVVSNVLKKNEIVFIVGDLLVGIQRVAQLIAFHIRAGAGGFYACRIRLEAGRISCCW